MGVGNFQGPATSCGSTIPYSNNDVLNDNGATPIYYGGPTPLVSISTSSPAATSGKVSSCYTALGSGNPNCQIDQRGLARLVGSNYSTGSYSVEVLGAPHIDTIGVYRHSASPYLPRLSNTTGNAEIAFGFGNGTQPSPVVGDWSGLGYDGTGLLNRANGQFLLSNTDNGINENFVFGNPGDE